MDGKWILNHGIHRGTITSRDSGVSEHNSRQEAIDYLDKQARFYKSIGYIIWFAELTSPDGEREHLGGNSDYR